MVSNTWWPSLRELGRDAHGDRRLADTALAHGHHHALAARRNLLDQGIEALSAIGGCRDGVDAYIGAGPFRSHLPQRLDTDQTERQERHVEARQPAQSCGHLVERGASASVECHGDGVVLVLRVEDAIEDQPDVSNADVVKLAARALGLRERWTVRTRHQHKGRLRAIAQRRVRGGVERLLRLESGEWAETRRPAHVGLDERGPCRGQLEQPQGVARRRRVEHHVVERARGVRVAEQCRELIERRDLDRAGA